VTKPTDLRLLIENAVSFALTGSNIAAEVTIADDLWPVEADEGQFGQVINNLLINAVQAMPLGGMVRVSAENRLLAHQGMSEKERYVAMLVSDQGEGITTENQAKIFDPYFTTKETGTGLGLTSAYSIVRKHGGAISFTSEPGKGTTFEILLPASREPVENDSHRVQQDVAIGRGLILVMDDEDYIRDIACEMLTMMGYGAEGFSCGEDLVRRYRDTVREGKTPSAVILDLTIRGGMGGQEAAKIILELDPAARLIVASGYSNNPVMANFRESGFAAALMKPFRLEDVGTTLQKVLEDR
jgi:CheY-like chemotaxis protein